MTTSREIIGAMIKDRRLKKIITQQQFADLLNVDRQYIWKLENGKVNLTMDYLDKIVVELGCLHSDFLVLL
jgi:transcriptional regulator with XRE-family HTH domain